MNDLSIHLNINSNCNLLINDTTDYSNLISNENFNYVYLEFLTKLDEDVQIDNTIKFSENLQIQNIIKIPYDSTFIYYKLVIPKLEHLLIFDSESNTYNDIILQGQTFYWDNKFYVGNNNISINSNTDLNTVINNNIEKILLNSSQITNYKELYIKQGDQTFSYSEEFFSYCKLSNCLVSLQKKLICNSRNCLPCDVSNSDRYKRDFLLSSLYVIGYLVELNKYDEAQQIIDNISSCSSLCEDDLNLNDCGCGTVN